MADKPATGQEVSKIFRVIAALFSDEMIKTTDHPEGVEVTGIMRDNWPDSPVIVRMDTATGTETAHLADIEITD